MDFKIQWTNFFNLKIMISFSRLYNNEGNQFISKWNFMSTSLKRLFMNLYRTIVHFTLQCYCSIKHRELFTCITIWNLILEFYNFNYFARNENPCKHRVLEIQNSKLPNAVVSLFSVKYYFFFSCILWAEEIVL